MVVKGSLHLCILAVAMLFATAEVAVAQFIPATLPCFPEQTLKLSGQAKPKLVSVTIGGRKISSDFDAGSGTLNIHNLAPEIDCNQKLRIDYDNHHVTFNIAAPPAKSVQDLQQISNSLREISNSLQQNSSNLVQIYRVVKDPPKIPDLVFWAAIIAGAAAVLSFVFALSIRLKQTEMMAVAESSEKKIKTVIDQLLDSTAKDPSQKYTQNLLKLMNASKDSGWSEAKFSQLIGKLEEVLKKVDNVGRGLARKEQPAPSADYIGPSTPSSQGANQSEMFRPHQEVPVASVYRLPAVSFEDAYNNAAPGMEDRLPGVVKVIAVTPRGVGDKNPNAKEPLIEDPSGELRIFFVREGNPYLAPSLETMALGIGGTYQRVWGHLFTFESREATTLKKAATVSRYGDEYGIVETGIMS